MTDVSPWPLTASRRVGGELEIGGVSVTELAAEFGTPLWVVDEADLRSRCRQYLNAFPGVDVAFAAKAWPATAILQIVSGEGLWVDVVSGGELRTAAAAGVPMGRVVFHGNNKDDEELRAAAGLKVSRVAIDSFDEMDRLEEIGRDLDYVFSCWLRVTPGIDAHTHEYVRTGHDDTKFGFTLSLGLADDALRRSLELQSVDVVGAHAHIGSQIFGTDPFIANADVMVELLARWRDEYGVTLSELNLGGGMAIRYTHEDHPVAVERYGTAVLEAVAAACERHAFPVPRLAVEPGRAIVAPSTVTLYEVGTVKHLPGIRTYVSVDGGMSDNIRPALYEAEHEIELANRLGDPERRAVTVVGKHCESGDFIGERIPLPRDLKVGDFVAVAATGAYTEAMASNYNRIPRPAAVLVSDGSPHLIIRREDYEDVTRRDIPLG